MKYVTLFLVLFCFLFSKNICAQKSIQKAIEKAIVNNSKVGKYYLANISQKKNMDAASINEYCKNKFVVRNIKTKSRQLFGALKTVVVSFEFRDFEDIRKEEIAEEKRKKELAEAANIRKEKERQKAEIRKEKLEAAEKLKRDKEKNTQKDKMKIDDADQIPNEAFKKYGYDFDIYSKTNLQVELFLKDSKNPPFILLHIRTNYKMYMIGLDLKDSQEITFDCYSASKNNQNAYFLSGFNQTTQKEEHFLLIKGAAMYEVTNLSIAPDEPLMMHIANKGEFEKLLDVSDLISFYTQYEYPKVTKLSEGFWGKTKVELREDFYYIIDNRWDYNEDLSCYNKCYSCDWFGGKGNKEVDSKDIWIYCQGKLLGKYLIQEITACNQIFYSHNGSNSFFGGGEYSSEYDAVSHLIDSKEKDCLKDEEFLTNEEKLQNANTDRAMQNYQSGRYSKVYPEDEDLSLIKEINISKDELINYKWVMQDGQSYEFNSDGTVVFDSKEQYIDLWSFTDDLSQIEIEFQPPHHNAFLNMTLVYCSIISIVKEGNIYYLYRADTSNGVGNCIKCSIQRLNK